MHGLPLQLTAEEVTLARDEGWAVLRGPVGGEQYVNTNDNAAKKRKWTGARYTAEDDDYESESEEDYYNDNEEDEEPKPAPWQDDLAHGSQFEIPTTIEEAQAAQEGVKESKKIPSSIDNEGKSEAVSWPFPENTQERHQFIVFRDLHQRGFRITGGSKFGADFLLYPGDPSLYHAQFCVRLMPRGAPILPALLASACRGSFQARKHLLIASVIEPGEITDQKGSNPKVQYMTFGPVDGFG